MKKRIVLFCCILLPIITASLLFAGHMKEIALNAIDNAIQDNIYAQVLWDRESLSISFFTDFPNASVGLSEIGIINNAPFDNQVLFYADALDVSIDIFSALGDSPNVTGIALTNPIIHIQVDKNGEANYDISRPVVSSEREATDAKYSLSIDHWEIRNGTLIYEDESEQLQVELKHIEHTGSGDFSNDNMQMSLSLESDSVFVFKDGVGYLTNKQIGAQLELEVENEFSKYTFIDNTVKVNDFTTSLNGSVELLSDSTYRVNVEILSADNQFTDLLSLIPAFYSKDFDQIQSTGSFDFHANAKGVISSTQIPQFTIGLSTDAASFRYAGQPMGIDDIQLNFSAENKTSLLEQTRIEISRFGMRVGQNQLNADLVIEDLIDYPIKGNFKGSANLSDLQKVYPLEDMNIGGHTTLEVTLNGHYDSLKRIMPALNGHWTMEDAFIKEQNGYSLNELQFEADLSNPSGKFEDFRFGLINLSFLLDDQPMKCRGTIYNLVNPGWGLNLVGNMNLEKLISLIGLEQYGILSGNMEFDLESQGNLADLENENYAALSTGGSLIVDQLVYEDPIYTDPVMLERMELSFDPRRIFLNNTKLTIANSDLNVQGKVENYMTYLFGEEALTGAVSVSSRRLDIDNLMVDTQPSDSAIATAESNLFRVPEDVLMQFDAKIGELLISGISLQNVIASAQVSNEQLELTSLNFSSLGGEMQGSAVYDTRSLPPELNFDLKASALDIGETAASVDFVARYMPVAKYLSGKIDSDIQLTGLVDEDYSLDLTSISSDARIACLVSKLESTPITQGIAQLTGLKETDIQTLEDLVMKIKIRDGKLNVSPFDFHIGPYKANVFGTNGLDGSVAYELTTYLPAGLVGKKLNTFAGRSEEEEIPVSMAISGSISDPEVILLVDEQKELVEQSLRRKAEGEVAGVADNLVEEVKDEETRKLIQSILSPEPDKKDSVGKVASDSTSTTDELKKKALDEVKNFFKKKKKDANQ